MGRPAPDGLGIPSDETGVPQHEMDKRLARVRQRMADRGLELLAVFSSPGNLRFGQRGHVLYLSGYEPYFGDCMLLLPLDPAVDAVLVKDAANYFAEGCTWVTDVRGPGDDVAIVRDFLTEHGLGQARVGVAGEYSIGPAPYLRLRDTVGPARLEAASDILERERSVKSAYELECLRGAAAIAREGLLAAARFLRPGVTGSDVKGEVERVCRAHGSQAFPHYTMVVSGWDEAYVSRWWQAERRVFEAGDPVSIDFGTMFRGYCCDVSRPFVLGKASARQKDTVKVLLEAHQAAADAARPGVSASAVQAAAAKVLTAALGDQDWWGLGHGVGLEVHEWPFVGYQRIVDDRAYEDRVLEEDTVISLEPTVMFADTGDLQIEDQFVVKPGVAVRLNDIPHEITEV